MRFLKVFLAALGLVAGVISASIGIMALQGKFTPEKISPDSIYFSDNTYMVDEEFELVVSAGNEEATLKSVELYFQTSGQVVELDGTISDGVIVVPKYIQTGVPFAVKLAQKNTQIGNEILPWVAGGVSTLRAKSQDELVGHASTRVFVDVPVHSLVVETSALPESASQIDFDVNSSFYAKASFLPEASAYKFSQNGKNGLQLEHKSVFFNSIENSFVEMGEITQNSFGEHSAVFEARQERNNVVINAYAFSSAKEEDRVLEEVSGIADVKARYEEMLSRFNGQSVRKIEENTIVNVSPLVVGAFSTSSLEIKTKYNEPIVVMVNKPVVAGSNHFNLSTRVLTSDGKTELTSHYSNIGIAFAVNENGLYRPATNNDFFVRAGKQIVSEINGEDYTFFLPNINSENLGESSWEITAKRQGMDSQLIVVLFNGSEQGAEINPSSFVDGQVKNIIDVQPQGKVSNRVYWNNSFTHIKTLYIQKSAEGDLFSNYNFVSGSIDNAKAYVNPSNTFRTVKYFAYLEQNGQIVSDDGLKAYNYINASKTPTVFNAGVDTILLYEIIDGDLIADKDELPSDYVIKVVFATIITDENQKPLLDENGGYLIDLVSRDNNDNLHSLNFNVRQVIKTLEAAVVFEGQDTAYDETTRTVAVLHKTDNAFKVVFEIDQNLREVFVRDFNANKIDVRFLINGQVTQGFVYTNPEFEIGDEFEFWVNIREINFSESGSDLFEIEINYLKGDFASGETDLFKVKKVSFPVENPGDGLIIEYIDATFEVYDGLISSLEFVGNLDDVNQNAPIEVKTALEVDEKDENGISLPSQSSSSSLSHATINAVAGQLYVNNESSVNIVNMIALDKYGKEIEFELNKWRLVSSDPSSVAVGSDGRTLSFQKTTNDTVSVHIETTSHAIGGKSLSSTKVIYFDVETRGSIVEVLTQSPDNAAIKNEIWGNKPGQNPRFYNTAVGAFAIENIDQSYVNNQEIVVEMEGRSGAVANLTTDQPNIFRVLYALPSISAPEGYFDVFDLTPITNFYLVGSAEPFEGFVVFEYNENGGIERFQIDKTFGRSTDLIFNAQTSIGLNFTVRVRVAAVIGATISQNFNHQNAQNRTENGIVYHGVFAEHKVEIDIVGFGSFNVLLSAYTPVVYDFDTKKVIAIMGSYNSNTIVISNNEIKIELYLPDVGDNTARNLRNLVFVLDNRDSIDANIDFERNMLDFSIDLNVFVNPNTKVEVSNSENVSVITGGVRVEVLDNQISNFVSVTDKNQGIFFVSGRVERRVALTTDNLQTPHLRAYISDTSGQPTINSFVQMNGNALEIKSLFNNSIEFYVVIEHVIQTNVSQKLGTFKVVLVPKIFENNENGNFITYDGTRYLQLVSTPGQDPAHSPTDDTSHSIYEFAALRGMFKTSKSQGEVGTGVISVGFDRANLNNWFSVQGQTITLTKNTEPRIGALNIVITLEGVGTREFPVILLPLKAPFVKYEGDTEPRDLTYSIGKIGITGAEKYEVLYNEDVYDIVDDAQEYVDIFANVQKENGLILDTSEPGLSYTLLNDPMSPISSVQIAEINDSNGSLETYKLGVDGYVVVAVRYLNMFEVFYRLKIVSSSEIKVFYPFEDVNQDSSDKAEHLFFNGNNTVSINFGQEFGEDIPARKQAINNLYAFDADLQEYASVVEYPNSRVGLFRRLEILAGEDSYEKGVLNLMGAKVIDVSTDNGAVQEDLWKGYVEKDQQSSLRFVFKYSPIEYTVIFELESDLFAKAQYKVVIAPTSPNYTIVENNGTSNIGSMTPLEENFEFVLRSPAFGEETIDTADTLNNLLLRKMVGSSFTDETQELKYHIFEDGLNILSINEDNALVVQFTPNTIQAKIMLYTKYGVVGVYDITVESNIYVAEKDATVEKVEHEMFAGSVFDFDQIVHFLERDKSIEEGFNAVSWNIEFKNPAQKPVYFIELEERINAFYILPIDQNMATVEMTVSVVLRSKQAGQDDENVNFMFNFTLKIKNNIESKYPNPSVAGQHPVDIFAGENLEIGLDAFFNDLSGMIELPAGTDVVVRNSEEQYFTYNLVITATNGANYVDVENITVNTDGKLLIGTRPVPNQNDITLKAVLTYEQMIGDYSHRATYTSYYSFTILEDYIVNIYHPSVNGINYESEKIVYSADKNINLTTNSMFMPEEMPRVEIITKDNSVATIADFTNPELAPYVKLRVIAGERNNLEINGVKFNEETTYSLYDTNFNFNLKAAVLTYSEVAFDVYVSGILRKTYKIDIYKDITSVYGVNIKNINQVEEDNREVFYLGEDRTEIFAGVQAIRFLVESNFNKNITLRVFRAQLNGGVQSLDMSIELRPVDSNFIKTIKPSHETRLEDLIGLTEQNIRFRIVENGVESGNKTISDLTYGTNNTPVVFARTQTGTNIQLLRRIEATYLGQPVQDAAFLGNLVFVEHIQTDQFDNYQIKTEVESGSLGDNNLFIDSSVEIYYGTNDEENSLSTYRYKHSVNLEVGLQEYEINVGEEIGKVLDAFQIQKLTGEKFVIYNGNNPTNFAEVIESQRVSMNLYFKTRTENGDEVVDYRVNNANEDTYFYEGSLAPITISERNILGSTTVYDFRLLAHGANNDGVVVVAIFEYKYKHPSGNQENDISFKNEIKITIKPIWEVYTNNRYITGENSEQNPEIISSDLFNEEDSFINYILIDTRSTSDERGIVVRKQSSQIDTRNYAIDFEKIEIQQKDTTYVSRGQDIVSTNTVVAKTLNIFKSNFSEPEFAVSLKDNYGFEVKFFFRVLPVKLIQYNGGLHNSPKSIYEGDKFVLAQNDLITGDDVHKVILTEQEFEPKKSDYQVRFMLYNNSTNKEIAQLTNGWRGIEEVQTFNYLNSEEFVRALNNVLVFMRIELKKQLPGGAAEIYIINSQSFFFNQRYITTEGAQKISDGLETNLVKHIGIVDKKANAVVGDPKLIDDQTLVVNDFNFHGTIKVLAFNSANDRKTNDVILTELSASEKASKLARYVSLQSVFGAEIANMLNYNFRIIEIDDLNQKIKLSYVNDDLTVIDQSGNTERKFVVRMADTTEVRDVIVEDLTSETVSASGGRRLGIIGYEVYDEDKSFTAQIVENEEDEQEVKLNIPEDLDFYHLVLTNYGTGGAKNIRQIKITRASATTFDMLTTSGAISAKHEEIKGITLSNSTIKLKFTHLLANHNFIDEGQVWVITSYEYKIDEVLINSAKFESVIDKKLVVVTTENTGQSVDVHFNGVNRKIIVPLNVNGKQEFSIFEETVKNPSVWGSYTTKDFNASAIALRYPQPINTDQLALIKGITYYNDTIEFKIGKTINGSGMISFRLFKENSAGIEQKDFSFEVSNYTKTFALGISQAFRDIDGKVSAVGDKYYLELVSIPGTVEFGDFKVIWPDGTESDPTIDLNQENLNFGTLDFGTYTITASTFTDKIEIKNGDITIELDSKELYERYALTKEVPVYKYYLIGFNQAIHYVDPIEFEVSPYYFGFDTSVIYGNSQVRVISDYTQQEDTENQDRINYVVEFETWTSDIPLLDPYGNYIEENNQVLHLGDAFARSGEGYPIIKLGLDTEGASGTGRLDPDNNNLIVNIPKELSIENVHFVIDVLVALNGKNIGEDTQWLKIGVLNIAFNAHRQFFLQPGEYLISTVKFSEEQEVDEIFVKYIEINSDGPTTFSVSRLFQDNTIQLSNVSTVKSENKKLDNVYLAEKSSTNYKVSYNTENVELNTVIKSEQLVAPVIVGNNISNGNNIRFTLEIGGSEINGSYTHADTNVLFGEIGLDKIVSDNNQTFSSLIGSETNYTLTSLDSTKAKVFWSKLDLTKIADEFNINFFGSGNHQNQPRDQFSTIIDASPMFKVSKLGSETKVKEIEVNIAPKPQGTGIETVENYAITQIILSESEESNEKALKQSQTIVYRVENSAETQKTIKINLYEMFEGTEEFTSIVLVEKLDEKGLRGPALFNASQNFYHYNVGTLTANKTTIGSDPTFDSNLQVYKKGQNIRVDLDDISDTFVIDLLRETEEYSNSGNDFLKHATIFVNVLEHEEIEDEDTQEITGYKVDANFEATSGKFYNLITKGERDIYEDTYTEDFYTYEYVSTNRDKLTFVGDEIKFVVETNSAGTLIWHEYISRTAQSFPLENFFYNKNGTTVKQSKNIVPITGLVDKDIITDMWDGTIFFGYTDEDALGKVVYTTTQVDEDDNFVEVEMFFIINDYRVLGTPNIKLAEILESFDGGRINKLKFGPITLHTSLQADFAGEFSNGANKAQYDENTYALFRINANQSAADLTIFDLIKAAPNAEKISRLERSKIKITSSFNPIKWDLESVGFNEGGYYSFYQEETEKFVIKKFEGSSNWIFNLFELFETNTLLLADGNVVISRLDTEISLNTTESGPASINIKLVQGDKEHIVRDIESINNIAIIRLEIATDSLAFFEGLTDSSVMVYQVDNLGNEIEIGQIITNGQEVSLVDIDIETSQPKVISTSISDQ